MQTTIRVNDLSPLIAMRERFIHKDLLDEFVETYKNATFFASFDQERFEPLFDEIALESSLCIGLYIADTKSGNIAFATTNGSEGYKSVDLVNLHEALISSEEYAKTYVHKIEDIIDSMYSDDIILTLYKVV